MAKLLVFDGNYMLHRAFSIAGKHRNPEHLEKSALSGFLQGVCSLAKERRATHVLVVFDSSQSFRVKIFPEYKANRRKEKGSTIVRADGSEYKTDLTPGGLVPKAKEIIRLSGITSAQKKGYEGDDLFGCVVNSLEDIESLIIEGVTRDKDMLGLVSDKRRVRLYWPKEKRLIDNAAVFKEMGVKPKQIRDLLALVGDKIDNIPGIDGWGYKTAATFLGRFGSIKKALDTKEGAKILKPYFKIIQLSKVLVTLKKDVNFELSDLVVQDFDSQLLDHVWKIPDALKDLGDVRKANSIRGLFGNRK